MMVAKSNQSDDLWQGGRFSARIRCILASNASPLTSGGTNTWLVGEPGGKTSVVVDPGPDDVVHLGRITQACLEEGRRIAAILLTHDHADHSEGASRLASLTGALILSRREGTLPDGPVVVPSFDAKLFTVSLAGHSSDSVGFYVPGDAAIITGDVIFAQSSTMVQWPDGELSAYFESLDTLAACVSKNCVEHFLPAHGMPIDDPAERIARCRRHRLQRLNQVVAAVRFGIPANAERIVDAVYNDIDHALRTGAICSVNAQLRYAFDEGLLEEHRA